MGMMDLPESAWAAALETHVAQACAGFWFALSGQSLSRSWNVAGSSCTDRGRLFEFTTETTVLQDAAFAAAVQGRRRTFTATLPKSPMLKADACVLSFTSSE